MKRNREEPRHDDDVPVGTSALKEFASTTTNLSHLGQLLQSMPRVTKALWESDPTADELHHLDKHGFPSWPIIRKAGEYSRLTDETILCRVIDAFHLYVADVIILANRGDRSSVARQLVEISAHGGFVRLLAYVAQDVLGRDIIIEGGAYIALIEAVALRNLIVFNRSVVDAQYLSEVGRTDLSIGARYPLQTSEVLSWISSVEYVAAMVDAAFVDRFSLKTMPLFPDEDVPQA